MLEAFDASQLASVFAKGLPEKKAIDLRDLAAKTGFAKYLFFLRFL